METINDNLKEANLKLEKSVRKLEKELRKVEDQKSKLEKSNEELKHKTECNQDVEQRARSLESHNSQLQNSLFDIAQIVVDDADQDEDYRLTEASPLTRSASKPVLRMRAG